MQFYCNWLPQTRLQWWEMKNDFFNWAEKTFHPPLSLSLCPFLFVCLKISFRLQKEKICISKEVLEKSEKRFAQRLKSVQTGLDWRLGARTDKYVVCVCLICWLKRNTLFRLGTGHEYIPEGGRQKEEGFFFFETSFSSTKFLHNLLSRNESPALSVKLFSRQLQSVQKSTF